MIILIPQLLTTNKNRSSVQIVICHFSAFACCHFNPWETTVDVAWSTVAMVNWNEIHFIHLLLWLNCCRKLVWGVMKSVICLKRTPSSQSVFSVVVVHSPLMHTIRYTSLSYSQPPSLLLTMYVFRSPGSLTLTVRFLHWSLPILLLSKTQCLTKNKLSVKG